MGNSQIVLAFRGGINFISIADKHVTFFDGQFLAECIFQRHNYQMYRVKQGEQRYLARKINALSNEQAIDVVEKM